MLQAISSAFPVFSPGSALFSSVRDLGSSGGGGTSSGWMFEAEVRTDVGRIREGNEDAFSVRPDLGLFLVADGMGGHKGGEVASRMAVDGIEECLRLEPTMSPAQRMDALREAFNYCSYRIFNRSQSDRNLIGMGTTLLVLHLDGKDGRYYAAWAGDSRLYRVRGDSLDQLTDDHSFHNQCRDLGIPEHQWRAFPSSIITRAVGIDEVVETSIVTGDFAEKDVFLLCTDGLTEVLDNRSLLQVIQACRALGETCEELINLANSGGGPDNITAALVRVLRAG